MCVACLFEEKLFKNQYIQSWLSQVHASAWTDTWPPVFGWRQSFSGSSFSVGLELPKLLPLPKLSSLLSDDPFRHQLTVSLQSCCEVPSCRRAFVPCETTKGYRGWSGRLDGSVCCRCTEEQNHTTTSQPPLGCCPGQSVGRTCPHHCRWLCWQICCPPYPGKATEHLRGWTSQRERPVPTPQYTVPPLLGGVSYHTDSCLLLSGESMYLGKDH